MHEKDQSPSMIETGASNTKPQDAHLDMSFNEESNQMISTKIDPRKVTLKFPLKFPFGVIFDMQPSEATPIKISDAQLIKSAQLALDQSLTTPQDKTAIARAKWSRNKRYVSLKIERTVCSTDEIRSGYSALRSLSTLPEHPPVIRLI